MNGMNPNGMGMQPMGQPAPAAVSMGPKVIGVLVPVVIQTPMGEVTVMAQFGEDQAGNVQGLLTQLIQAGWPLKAYPPKQPQGNGYGGGGGYGGGYNGGGGSGYGGGGYRPRGRW